MNVKGKLKALVYRDQMLLLHLAIICAGFIFLLFGITHEDMWYDECYSSALKSHSLGDICRITAGDSHPPLYYILLKGFTLVFGDSIFTLRLFSALGVIAIALLGIGPVKRIFGPKFGIIFSFVIFITPAMYSYAQEVRMYTWASFFVTASAVYGYLCLFDKSRKTDWVLMGLSSLAAAYTHYYALLAVCVLHGLIFILIIVNRRRKLPCYLCMITGMVLLYFPWISFMKSQVIRIHSSYWIGPVTKDTVLQTLVYPFNHKFTTDYAGVLPIFCIAVLITLWGMLKAFGKNRSNKWAVIYFSSIFCTTLISSIVISKLFRPLLIPRYMLVVTVFVILGICYGISVLEKKQTLAITLAVFVFLVTPQFYMINSHRYNSAVREAVEWIKKDLQNDDIFLYTDGNTFGTFCYYFQDYKHYYVQKPKAVTFSNYDAFKPNGSYGNNLTEFLKGKKNVYVITRKKSYWNLSVEKSYLVTDDAHAPRKDFGFKESWFLFDVQKVPASIIRIEQ